MMDELSPESDAVMRAVDNAFERLASEVRGDAREGGPEFYFRHILIGLFGRSLRSVKAVAILVRGGYTMEAELLTRYSFELLVEMLLLAEDPGANAERYRDYVDAAKYKLVRHSDELERQHGFGLMNASDEDRRRFDESHSAFLSKHSVNELPRHWSGIDQLEQRVIRVNLMSVYERAYRRQSRIGHVHPQTNHRFWEQQSDGRVVFKAYPDFEDVHWCVSTGCLIASCVLELACHHLELACGDAVNEVRQQVKQYSDADLARACNENAQGHFI